jgi:hypothetical protein
VYTINVFLPRANIFLLLAKIIVDNRQHGGTMGARGRNALMSPEAYENALDRQYDDHVAEMEEMGFGKEAQMWLDYEDLTATKNRVNALQDYFFNEDIFLHSEAKRLRGDSESPASWALLDTKFRKGTDKEIAELMRSVFRAAMAKAGIDTSKHGHWYDRVVPDMFNDEVRP